VVEAVAVEAAVRLVVAVVGSRFFLQ